MKRGLLYPQEATDEPIGQTNVDVLLGWSDEHGVVRLKSRCEDYLLTSNFEDPEKFMKIALTFRLPSLKQDTAKLIAHYLYKHRSCIAHCIGDPGAMKIILPPLRHMNGITGSSGESADLPSAEDLCPNRSNKCRCVARVV